MDPLKSQVPDPGAWDAVKVAPQTAWRTDRMKNMTYTQFWQLVQERRVDKVGGLVAASVLSGPRPMLLILWGHTRWQ